MSRQIYYTYLLKCWSSSASFKKGHPKHGHVIYTGYTNNIIRRLTEHLTGKRYSKRPTYTSQFKGMLELGYLEAYTEKKEATSRELQIKSFSRDEKIKLMDNALDEEKAIITNINNIALSNIKK